MRLSLVRIDHSVLDGRTIINEPHKFTILYFLNICSYKDFLNAVVLITTITFESGVNYGLSGSSKSVLSVRERHALPNITDVGQQHMLAY